MTLTLTNDSPQALARRNFSRNLAALRPTALAQRVRDAGLPDADWVFGRDATLTARVDGSWLAGTGLPGRVAAAMVAKADATAPSLCLLAPTHGRQVTALLERLGPTRALVAVFAGAAALAWALRCVDVSEALSAGRLHVVAVDPEDLAASAEAALVELVDCEPGLVVPGRLFRPADATAAAAWVEPTAAALRAAGRARAERAAVVAAREPDAGGAVAVVAGGALRLWHDAGAALWRAVGDAGTVSVGAGAEGDARTHRLRSVGLADGPGAGERVSREAREARGETGVRFVRVDVDDPRSASPLAVGLAAGAGVVAADVLRGDLPGTVSERVPWVTWVTTPRAAMRYGGGRDAVVLAEGAWAARWKAAGWPAARVSVAAWPTPPVAETDADAAGGVVLIADLPAAAPPASVEAYSSQTALWRRLADEIERAPMLLHAADSPETFVRRRAAAAGVADVPLALFVGGCVLPAYARGVALSLAKADLIFGVYGRGWEGVDGLNGRWRGEVEGREHFNSLRAAAAAVVVATPTPQPAAAEAGPRGIITAGLSEAALRSAVGRAAPTTADPDPRARMRTAAIASALVAAKKS